MPPRHTHKIPFFQRSRKAQKHSYIKIRNDIRRATPILGGKFYTHNYMDGGNGWIDGYFLSKKSKVAYCFAIQTCLYAYKESVRDSAWKLSYEKASVELDSSIFDKPARYSMTGLQTWLTREPHCYHELSGMTRSAWAESQHERIADSGEIQVFEHWTLHKNYRTGIGLHATIDVPQLDIETVNAFIDRFSETEAVFGCMSPITFSYEQIENWGIEINAVAQPWD